MSKNDKKTLAFYISPEILKQYGEDILKHPAAKNYILLGFALTRHQNIRDFILLKKDDNAKYSRVFVTSGEPVLIKAYEHFLSVGSPDLYWTTLFIIGLKASEDGEWPVLSTSGNTSAVNTQEATIPQLVTTKAYHEAPPNNMRGELTTAPNPPQSRGNIPKAPNKGKKPTNLSGLMAGSKPQKTSD